MKQDEPGTLYLCATPIGNLKDITARAVQTLSAADVIAAEDTRHTRQLLTHLGIRAALVSYHEHNKDKQGPLLLAQLEEGKDVALVSDAGFPGIADPGEHLARLAIASGIKVVPIPGANAALCALIASGLPSSPFFFGGFLPKSKKNRRHQLGTWEKIPATIVLYEAPHRVKEVLKDILAAWGDRRLAIGRELTKLHEEFFRGTVSEALGWLEKQPPRGEFSLVIAAPTEVPVEASADEDDVLAQVRRMIAEGTPKKEALQRAAKESKIPRRKLYNRLILAEEGEKE